MHYPFHIGTLYYGPQNFGPMAPFFLGKDEELQQDELLRIVFKEMETVQNWIDLRLKDSRIGFESSNHYFYTLQGLKEKMINLAYCEARLM